MKEKLAILGASYLQRPLVEKAREMGVETHVFAWREGCVVEDIADHFYPVSILDQEEILRICEKIQVAGITSIGSDIAMPTVSYVAEKLGLKANSTHATRISTDKYEMRKALSAAGIKCPGFQQVEMGSGIREISFGFPMMVKPVDRSGSLAVTKVKNQQELGQAIEKAGKVSLSDRVIVEEFVEGREFSVEMISYEGKHHPITITDKITSGDPYYVELEQHQPAALDEVTAGRINDLVIKTLDALELKNGASHTEVLLTKEGELVVVEAAGRMGGDFIGSHMVPLSTGYDFLKAVIEVALDRFSGIEPSQFKMAHSGVFYVLPNPGVIKKIVDHSQRFEHVRLAVPILKVGDRVDEIVDGSGKRAGIVLYAHPSQRLFLNPGKVLVFETERLSKQEGD
ncbi:MAG: ATP-grasp domain-containing protein [Candidatus Cloacimonetes bacterium]|nr:ATP-grasp domain-containing protein [Candidatus Cloacimonadota bacterium]